MPATNSGLPSPAADGGEELMYKEMEIPSDIASSLPLLHANYLFISPLSVKSFRSFTIVVFHCTSSSFLF
jgi:hypothetical protein